MGKRPAGVELFEGNMVSMQREIRPSMQRDEPPTMATGLERIAGKARCGPNLRFTSLAHHITPDRVWRSLCQIPNHSAPGVDGQTVSEAKESFEGWIGEMLQSVHRKGYKDRISGVSISRSPANRRNARWACRLYLTGRCSAARPRCYPPYTSRIS